jgi:ATP-dependent helicase HepA
MRLEQRIGRIDRIGRNRPARTRVLSCYADVEDEPTAASAWLKVLAFGFGIFTGSVSDLQFHLEAERERLLNLLFEQGPEALHHAVDAEVVPGVSRARREIAAQAEMDAMERDVAQDEDWVRSLVELEADDRPLREEYEHWICDALKLNARVEDASRMVFQYEANYDRVLSDVGSHPTLVPMDRWNEWPGRGDPLTYCRIAASMRPSVRLLRPGDAFTDALDEYVRWDERGRVYALHRHVPHMPTAAGSEIVCFRVDLLAEADVRPAVRAVQKADKCPRVGERALRRVLQRRADALLPPTYETLYLDFDGMPVKDELLLAPLRLPYTKRDRDELGTDVNLTGDYLDYLEQVVDSVTWPSRCRKIASSAKAALRSSGDMVRAIEAATDRFLWESRLRQDRLRLRATKGGDAAADLCLEEVIAPALTAGLERPRLRVESIGVFVLGGNDPRPDDPEYARARRSR